MGIECLYTHVWRLLLLSGRLSDLLGRKRIFLVGLLIFGISSLLIGLSQTANMMIAMRAIQGIGSSIIAPTTLALIMDAYKGDMRQKLFHITVQPLELDQV